MLTFIFIILSYITIPAQEYPWVPCKVIDASDNILVCESYGNFDLGNIFSFYYGQSTKAKTYPRYGRIIKVYYHPSYYRPYILYDWFLYRWVERRAKYYTQYYAPYYKRNRRKGKY